MILKEKNQRKTRLQATIPPRKEGSEKGEAAIIYIKCKGHQIHSVLINAVESNCSG